MARFLGALAGLVLWASIGLAAHAVEDHAETLHADHECAFCFGLERLEAHAPPPAATAPLPRLGVDETCRDTRPFSTTRLNAHTRARGPPARPPQAPR